MADVNVQAHLTYLRHLLDSLELWPVLAELNLRFVTFAELQIVPDILDRPLWNRCQEEGWVLFTENRNQDDADSLEATLRDSWQIGHLPVLTLANKSRFEHNREYAQRVAADVAELLFGIAQGEYSDQSRIYVPQ
ncbi:MAG: hypothetical protein K8T91_04065 [Planctomycetes bacterium]|nr:hypothetical protein [Planctomycetota bacterium]